MKKCLLTLCLFVVALFCGFSLTPVQASADTGPKPSVRITVNGLGNQACIATLLGEREHNGPWGKWGEDEWYDESVPNDFPDAETMRRFSEYAQNDGFYFYGRGWELTDGDELAWTYYPPSRFKLLLYFPETETFLVSDAYETYAFHSYYQTDARSLQNGKLNLSTANGYGREALGLAARVAITVAIELGIAFLYKFRKKQFWLLAGTNVATQVFLNLMLNVLGVHPGGMGYLLFIPADLLLEAAVFAIEAIVYSRFMNRLLPSGEEKPKKTYVGYALAANAVSLVVGIFLAHLIPSIF